ncbi:MAG: CheR family methyltransferase [Rheinheimera sp.]|nr:CheR family methyltransferase [Rheinheimera sp.]
MLATAAKGIYSLEKLKGLPIEYCRQFFFRGKGANAGAARVIPELQECIEFKKINLLDPQWPINAPIDVIFCRNVMIYFDKANSA